MIIKARVKTGCNEQEIKRVSIKNYEIRLKAGAEDNKANIELLKLLKRRFKKDVRIIKGWTKRNKILEIKKTEERW